MRWESIEQFRKNRETDIDDEEWETAALRSALIVWGGEATETKRNVAARHAATNAEAIEFIGVDWAFERLGTALRTYTDREEPDTEDWMVAIGLGLMATQIGNDTEIGRALQAVNLATARTWHTPEGQSCVLEILENTHAINAAARCTDKIKNEKDPNKRAALYKRWAQCAWEIKDENSCESLARKAISINPQDREAWHTAIRTTAKPWGREAFDNTTIGKDERKLWRAWEIAMPNDPEARIVGTMAQIIAPRSGSKSAMARRRDKTRAILAKDTAKARKEKTDIEPRILWLASTLLQDDESRQWTEGIAIEQMLLCNEGVEDALLLDIAELRLAEGRGIEPALEHMMDRETEKDGRWRTSALAENIAQRAEDLKENESMFPEGTVIERGLRGPPHQRAVRKQWYERDAQWCAKIRTRCQAKYTKTSNQEVWTLLERISLAERRVHMTTPSEYRRMVTKLSQKIDDWIFIDDTHENVGRPTGLPH